MVIVPDVLVLEAEDADQGDEEHDVGEGQQVVTGAVVTPGHQTQPLQGYHNLMSQCFVKHLMQTDRHLTWTRTAKKRRRAWYMAGR